MSNNFKFLIEIISRFRRDGAKDAQSEIRKVGDEAEEAASDAEILKNALNETNSPGIKKAQQEVRKVGTETKKAGAQANPGPFGKFFRGIQSGAKNSVQSISRLSGELKGLLAFAGIGGIGMLTRSVTNLAEETQKGAQLTGLTTREWQRSVFAAKQNKATADDLQEALHQLNRRAEQMPEAFEKWGIATRDSNGEQRETLDILRDIADRMQAAGTAGERAAMGSDLMEGAGKRLIPLLRQGSDAFDAFGDMAEDAGQVMEGKLIRQLNEANDALSAFGTRATITAGTVVGKVHDMAAGVGEAIGGIAFGGTTEAEFDDINARKQAIRELEKETDHTRLALTGDMPIPLFGGDDKRRQVAEAQEAVEKRVQEILNEQTRAKLEQAKADEDAQAAAARLAEEKAIHENIATARKQFAAQEAQRAEDRLSDAEKLARLEERIAAAKHAALMQGDLEAAQTAISLTDKRLQLEQQIAEAKETEAQAERERQQAEEERQQAEKERQQAQAQNLADLEAEHRILEARAAGNDQHADQLEHQQKLRREAQRIQEQTGVKEEQARQIAARRLDLEKQIAAAKKDSTEETKKQQTEEERLLEIARRDIEGRTVAGREARSKLQESGHISRNQTDAIRQLRESQNPPATVAPIQSPGLNPVQAARVADDFATPALPSEAGRALDRQGQAFTQLATALKAHDSATANQLNDQAREIDRLAKQLERHGNWIKGLR